MAEARAEREQMVQQIQRLESEKTRLVKNKKKLIVFGSLLFVQ